MPEVKQFVPPITVQVTAKFDRYAAANTQFLVWQVSLRDYHIRMVDAEGQIMKEAGE